MLCVGLHAWEFKMIPTKRRLFFQKFKLKFTNWYFENQKNINQTANMRNRLKDEKKIHSVKRSKKTCRYGTAKFPVIDSSGESRDYA